MLRIAIAVSIVLLNLIPAVLSADDRPNIVFLFADDQCTYSMGCYVTPGVKTPQLDQLAKDSLESLKRAVRN